MKTALFALLLAACTPSLGPRTSLITDTRIIAVTAEPPEVTPGETAEFKAFVASPLGPQQPSIEWSLCRTPKPYTEDNAVAPACLQMPPTADSPSLTTTFSIDVCRLFGPDQPPPIDGQQTRARDPDASGGYYQPIILSLAGNQTAAEERIRCPLAGASAEAAAAYAAQYKPNQNPTMTGLTLTIDGKPTTTIPAGATVTLTPTIETIETYPSFDIATQTITTATETVSVSYFVTDGVLTVDRTGSDTPNVWQAPQTGPVTMWLVARDNRGGTAVFWETLAVN